MVAAGIADEVLVELSYAIGIARPLSVYVDTYRSKRPAAIDGMTDGEIARRIERLFDLRPAAIVKRFGLTNPIFEATASYGHFGNRPYTRTEKLWRDGHEVEREIEYFGWEKLDAVELIRKVRTLTLRRRRRKNGTTAAKPSSRFPFRTNDSDKPCGVAWKQGAWYHSCGETTNLKQATT